MLKKKTFSNEKKCGIIKETFILFEEGIMANVHDGHRDRMRKRFAETGFAGFQPHEILELLLFYSVPRKDTNTLAHTLLGKYNSISGVLNANLDDLAAIDGISYNTAVLIKLIPQLANIYISEQTNLVSLENTAAVRSFFEAVFVGITSEKVFAAALNDRLEVVASGFIGEGNSSFTPVNFYKTAEIAIRAESTLLIVGHNHPQGNAVPSDADIRTAKLLCSAMKGIGIKLLDCVIVGRKGSVSMLNNGTLFR